MTFSIRRWSFALSLAFTAACGSRAKSPTEAQPETLDEARIRSMFAPCPMDAKVTEPSPAGQPRQVFVEINVLEVVEATPSLRAQIAQTPHILASDGIPATISIGPAPGAVHLEVTPTVGVLPNAVKLDLVLEGTSDVPVKTTVAVQSGQSVTLPMGPLSPSTRNRLAIVNAYVIDSRADLQAIFACKRQKASRPT